MFAVLGEGRLEIGLGAAVVSVGRSAAAKVTRASPGVFVCLPLVCLRVEAHRNHTCLSDGAPPVLLPPL